MKWKEKNKMYNYYDDFDFNIIFNETFSEDETIDFDDDTERN